MRTLGRFATNLLEAGWLAAVVLIPLFIDKDSAQAFDAAKAGLLHAIAVLMLVAWITKALTSPAEPATSLATPVRLRASLRVPLVVPLALFLGVTLLATVCSLSPSESWWGHRGRAQGVITLLAELVIFAATAANLTSASQLRRLVTGLILPSVPIALYAVCQRMQLEPMLIKVDTDVQRATSFLGQPVYLAAYLGMVVPFTALRAIEPLCDLLPFRLPSSLARVGTTRFDLVLRASVYGLLLLLQLVALLFSESRGPVLGLAVAGALAFLACAALRGLRRRMLALWAVVGAAALLIALGLPARLTALSSGAQESRVARRAAETFAVTGSGGTFRTTSWNVAARVLHNATPLELADGSHDPRHGLRRLIGYGPELQYAISPPFYDSELPRLFEYIMIDRYHNQLWDTLLTTGLLGLSAWLAVEATLLWLALRTLGLLRDSAQRRLFWGALGAGTLVSMGGWMGLRGLPFVFLGLQTGVALGVAVFLSVVAWAPAERAQPVDEDGSARLQNGVLIAALAAIVSHLIETSFSFVTLSTAALFWVVCALLSACARAQPAGLPTSEEPTGGDVVRDASLLGWSVIALGFTFLGASSQPGRTGAVLWDGLTLLSLPGGERKPVVLTLVLSTLLVGALLLRLDRAGARSTARTGFTLGVSVCIALVFWLQQAGRLAERARTRATLGAAFDVATNLSSRASSTTVFYVSCLLLALLFAARGARSRARIPHTQRALPWWRGALALFAALLGLLTIERFSLEPAHAEAAVALGDALKQKNLFSKAELAYQQAIRLLPHDDVYRATLAKAYVKHARADAAHASAWFERADQTLREAIALNPADSENITNLSVVTQQRALLGGPAQRAAAESSVVENYARALRLNPLDPNLWRLWGGAQLRLLGDARGALASAQHALPLEPNSAASYALIGESQVALSRAQAGEASRERMLAAASAYEKAVSLAPDQTTYRIHSGQAYLAVGQPKRAAAAFRLALSKLPASARDRPATLALLQRAESAVTLTAASPVAQ